MGWNNQITGKVCKNIVMTIQGISMVIENSIGFCEIYEIFGFAYWIENDVEIGRASCRERV